MRFRAQGSLLAVLLATGGPGVPAEPVAPSLEASRAYRAARGAQILASYADLLRRPNVTGEREQLAGIADWLVDALRARGATAERLEIDGAAPIVLGFLAAPNAERTLGIYVHYDGQPVDRTQWTHDPFEPALYSAALDRDGERLPMPAPGDPIDPEWRLYARSASDDKAPFAAMLTALDALSDAGIDATSNLVFLFEGEEESGSTHLGDYLRRYRERLDPVDLWLICDGPVHQSRRPQLVFGVRGYTGFEVTVYGAERYLHSGHYGNWAPNPAQELAELLASMKDPDGTVLVDGFYDDVTPLTSDEREALERIPSVDERLLLELGLARTEGDGRLAERINLPSLNVKGLASATVGETARNIIPTVATAVLDVRLVLGNDPGRMLDRVERHIERQGYHIVRETPDRTTRLAHPRLARVVRGGGYPAVRTPMDLELLEPVIEAANAAAGEPVVLMPTLGGSLPLYLFEQQLERPLVIVPIANHDNNQHGPDENLRLANLWYGIDLFAALLTMPEEER